MTLYYNSLPMMKLANHFPGPEQGHWTYEDYARLPEDGKRYEIMNGFLLMTPSPTWSHQNASFEIASHLRTLIKISGRGEVIVAPFDVELAPEIVVQPDILVVLREHFDRLTEKRLIGAPDLIVEVASPATSTYDRNQKYQAYAAAGVAEYWIVDPEARTVEVLVLEGKDYRALGIYRGQSSLSSLLVPDLNTPVEQFFV